MWFSIVTLSTLNYSAALRGQTVGTGCENTTFCFTCSLQLQSRIGSVLMFTKVWSFAHGLQHLTTRTRTSGSASLGLKSAVLLIHVRKMSPIGVTHCMMGQPFCLHLNQGFIPEHFLVWILNSISVHLINGGVSYLTSWCQSSHFNANVLLWISIQICRCFNQYLSGSSMLGSWKVSSIRYI